MQSNDVIIAYFSFILMSNRALTLEKRNISDNDHDTILSTKNALSFIILKYWMKMLLLFKIFDSLKYFNANLLYYEIAIVLTKVYKLKLFWLSMF